LVLNFLYMGSWLTYLQVSEWGVKLSAILIEVIRVNYHVHKLFASFTYLGLLDFLPQIYYTIFILLPVAELW
jgi:hypothetical protein